MPQKPKRDVTEIAKSLKPICSASELAELLHLSVKTIYDWIAAGRFEHCRRKRGKHWLIITECALFEIFNGPDWGKKE